MSSISPLSNPFVEELKEQFTRQDYCSKTIKAKEHALCYLIVLKQPEEIIADFVQILLKENASKIDNPSFYHRVTPLSIAVIMQQINVIKALLDAGANPNKCDDFGWNACLFSALATDEISSLLFERGGRREHVSIVAGLTYDLLLDVLGKTQSHAGLERLTIQTDDALQLRPSKKEVEKFMGIKSYRTHSLYSIEHIRNLWDRAESHEILDHVQLPFIKEALLKPHVKLKLKEVTIGIDLDLSKNKGLFAGQLIKKGQFITRYSGASIAEKTSHSFLDHFKGHVDVRPYLFEKVDAEHIGNESRMMNDGFPNVFILSHGMETFFFAINDIDEGQELLWNYGISDARLKFGSYLIKNKLHMRQMVKENFDDWLQRLHRCQLVLSNPKSIKIRQNAAVQDAGSIYSYIKYILDTPAAMIDLIVSESLKVKNLDEIFDLDFIKAEHAENTGYAYMRAKIYEFVINLQATLQSIEEKSKSKEIQEALLTTQDKMPVMNWLKLIRYIMNLILMNQKQDTLSHFAKLLPNMIERAKAYKFTEFDKTCPLIFDAS
jgi:hypothetical protein